MYLNTLIVAFVMKVILFLVVCFVIRWAWRNLRLANAAEGHRHARQTLKAMSDPVYADRVGYVRHDLDPY